MNGRVSPPLLPGIIAVLLAIGAGAASAQQAPNGNEILKNVDETMSAPRDQDVEATLVLVDKDGNRKERTLRMYQKGADTRMARFLTPADQKGISVLSLPDGSIYLYLPAFKKVKRIASSVKNTTFAGTDFTYEDMEARRYADSYTAELVRTEGERHERPRAPAHVGQAGQLRPDHHRILRREGRAGPQDDERTHREDRTVLGGQGARDARPREEPPDADDHRQGHLRFRSLRRDFHDALPRALK
jgi:hypothetical protein